MCNHVSFVRVKSFFKIAISIFLCFCIIVIPFVQRANAVVTTTTVVVILILTLLTAMGITLVIADGTKEAFIEQKGDEFMQSKGYSGSFADWIKGQSDIQIGLKVGFLMLAKDVVDRIKEFVNWLIPGAQSNTVVQLGSGTAAPIYNFILTGTITYNKYGYAFFHPSGTIYVPTTGQVLTNGVNTVTWGNEPESFPSWTGYYDKYNLSELVYVPTPGGLNYTGNNNVYMLAYVSEPYKNRPNNNAMCRPGIYVVAQDGDLRYDTLVFPPDDFIENGSDDSAVIADYDDLSGLTNTTVTENGTTTVYNTFYITQDGQALQTGQDIADIVGALQQALDDLNRKLEVIPQTAETAAKGTITPNYSDFDLGNLDLSGLGALLTTRFPFSIPWDIIRIFQTFVAEPEAPSWTVDLLPIEQFENVNTEITIDLGQYPLVGQISRYFCIIELCIGLCYITKRLVWTA